MSLKDGFEYCLLKGRKGDILVSMDCDNSHTIPLSFRMINAILNKKKILLLRLDIKKLKDKWIRSNKNFFKLWSCLFYTKFSSLSKM